MANSYSNSQIKKPFKLGFGFILGWLVGLFFIFISLGAFPVSPVTGILSTIGGLMLIPTVWDITRSKLNFELSRPLRAILFIIFTILAISFYSVANK